MVAGVSVLISITLPSLCRLSANCPPPISVSAALGPAQSTLQPGIRPRTSLRAASPAITYMANHQSFKADTLAESMLLTSMDPTVPSLPVFSPDPDEACKQMRVQAVVVPFSEEQQYKPHPRLRLDVSTEYQRMSKP